MDALLVVDIQNDFCSTGALPTLAGERVVPVINRLLPRFEVVVITQDWHPLGHISFASTHEGHQPFDTITLPYGEQELWPDHCVPGTWGAELHPDLETRGAHLILRKGYHLAIDSYSVFRENDRRTRTGLQGWLKERGVTTVWLAGLATDYCVLWSAQDAQAAGFEVVVVEDAVSPVAEDTGVRALQAMREAGVRMVRSAEVLG